MAPPDDLPIDDPPRQFPDWMRRLDPRLAAEDTNALFRAFLIRRTVHKKHRTWRERLASRLPREGRLLESYLRILVLPLILIHYLFGFDVPYIIPMTFVCCGIFWWQASRPPQRDHSSDFPSTVHELFNGSIIPVNAAKDLWMTPLPVRDVLEAAYLDSRQQHFKWVGRTLPISVCVVAVLLLGRSYHHYGMILPGYPLAVLGVVVLAGSVALVWTNVVLGSFGSGVDQLLYSWRLGILSLSGNTGAAKSLRAAQGTKGTFCSLFIVFGVVFYMFAWSRIIDLQEQWLLMDFFVSLGLYLLLLSIGVLLAGIALSRRRGHSEAYYIDTARYLYDVWLSVAVLEDRDGMPEALRRHGKSILDVSGG